MAVISELRACLSPGKVSTMAEVLEEHGTDRWNFSHLPEVVGRSARVAFVRGGRVCGMSG